jgi:HPt (histidine-containing phosphotransfer) domain-containing protein
LTADDPGLDAPALEVVDEALLGELAQLADEASPDFLSELVGVFRREAEHQLDLIDQAVDQGDVETVQRSAHTLKGSSASLGAIELPWWCGRMEGVTSEAELRAAPTGELRAAYGRFVGALGSQLGGSAS